MVGKILNTVLDKEKIPHLVFYCIGFVAITLIYGIKAALFLVLFVLNIWAYSNLILELYLKAKEEKSKRQTANKGLVIGASSTIFLTVLGTLFFTKLIWGYIAVLTTMVVFIPVIFNRLRK